MRSHTRSSAFFLVLSAVLLSGCAGGPQLRTVERIPDKPRPADQTGVANFESILMQKVSAHSVYTRPKDPALMRRLLLSPNLVFDSSRSSLDEVRAADPALAAPHGADAAVGEPVETELSTALIKYLSDKGSIVIAPAVTRRGSWDGQCTGAVCPKTTWVERLLLVNQKPPVAAPGKTGDTGLADLPTAALAVRQLGISNRRIDVVALAVATPARPELVFRPRRAADEPSACEQVTFNIPVVSFVAEVISIKDGRVLARIDEQRTPRFIVELKPAIALKGWRPQTATGYTTVDADGGAPRGGEYTYVGGWLPEDQGCRSALKAYREVLEEAYKQMDSKLLATVGDILQLGLDPLY